MTDHDTILTADATCADECRASTAASRVKGANRVRHAQHGYVGTIIHIHGQRAWVDWDAGVPEPTIAGRVCAVANLEWL